MLRFACSFRKHKFSSTAFELGKKVSTETVDSSTSKFFQLVPLNGLEEALSAPENAVVVESTTGQNSYNTSKNTNLGSF